MNDDQLLRYSRQIMLPSVDIDGQERLLASTVLIVGLGGLGSPIALYLAAAGVGHLVLADHDAVDLSNLQRQIAHHTASVGKPKVDSAAGAIRALNPDTRSRRSTSVSREMRWPAPSNASIWYSTAPITSPRVTRSTTPASRPASRWYPARRSARKDKWRCSTRASPTHRVTDACIRGPTMRR